MATKPNTNIQTTPSTLPAGLRSKRLAALKERARRRGIRAIDKCVQLLVHFVEDDRYSPADRKAAANDLLDRYGQPRLSAIANIEEVMTPKLIEIRDFQPPPTFNPNPPSSAEVIENEAPPEAPLEDEAP